MMVELLFVELAKLAVMLIIAPTVCILFLLSLRKTLDRCLRRNRTIGPALVWLCLIPLFNLAWIVRVVFAVGDSLRNEYADRDIDRGSDYGKTIGVLWLVSTLVAIGVVVVFGTLFGFSRLGMLVSLPFSIASLVLFVVYWIQVVSYRRQLERDRDQDDERDFDDDDRLRLPSRPDDRIR